MSEKYYLNLFFVPKMQLQMLVMGGLSLLFFACFIGITAGAGFFIGVLI